MYAYAGLALYWAQCFEMSLTNALMLYERASNIKITLENLESLESELRQKTLGGLLNRTKKTFKFDEGATKKINAALEARNFLVHHFFRDRAIDFLTPDGRSQMISELEEMQATLSEADTVAMALCGAFCEAIGITKEMLNAEFDRLYSNACGN